jgi:DNA-binding LacI/PurR family transcriptional regulator
MTELGYRRNVLARALATRRTRIIALAHPILDRRLSHGTNEFITSAASAARARGYHLVLWPVDPDSDEIGELLGQGLVDGVVLMEVLLEDARVEALAGSGTPFALIGRTANPAGLIHVDIDFDRSMSDALSHLQDLGHSEIALITAREALPEYGPKVRSQAAYLRLCAERKLTPLLLEAEPAGTAGPDLLPRLAGSTAVILMNEFAGFGLLAELARAGVDVPRDLSVVSFTSPELAAIASPPLTIMHSPGAALGALGVDALLDHLEDPGQSPPPRLLPHTLEPGGSTARPPSPRSRP